MSGEGRRGGPAVSETSLHSYLVTRHTGRAVRMTIEERISGSAGPLLTVLDFREVAVIDFSCADEVVAKLVEGVRARGGAETYFFFRGLDNHHMDPVESALVRRTLAVAGESVRGDPMLVGAVDGADREAWRAVQRLGRAPAAEVARAMELAVEETRPVLERLSERRLVVDEGRQYVSLRHALDDAGDEEARGP